MQSRVIDFHTHPWRRREDNYCYYPFVIGEGTGAILDDMQRAGIGRFAGSVILKDFLELSPEEAVRRTNEETLLLKAELGDAYIPGMTVHPEASERSCRDMERMKAEGVTLVGELVPYMHGWGEEAYLHPGLDEILSLAGEYSMLVSIHRMGPEFDFEVARRHPNVNFVIAHPGEKDAYFPILDAMRELRNLYLDLSGGGLFRYGMLAHGVKTVGAERILFGSDYPICNPAMNLRAVEYERITSKERDMILYENAERLLHL